MKAVTFLLWQLREIRFIQRFAFLHGRKGYVLGITVDGNALFQRATLYRINGAVVTLIETTVDRAFFLLIGRMFKYCWKGRQQIINELLNNTDQLAG